MQFFHITKNDNVGSHKEQSQYFSLACAKKDITYHRIIDEDTNALTCLDIDVRPGDIVFRSASSVRARSVEKELVSSSTRTIYFDNKTVITGRGSSFYLMRQAGLPIIPSVSFLPKKKRDSIAVAESLDGFPIIIKVQGGMEGVGVIRADSIQSFNSVIDYINMDPSLNTRVMKYIPHELFARLVVVGDEVVASTCDYAPLGDFRANARGPREKKGSVFHPTEQVKKDAIAAVKAVGSKIGGVDVLLTESGEHYFAEVNTPFNFAETQQRTGVDIASYILEAIR